MIKGRTLTAWAPHLAKGAYTVRWHAMSGDGHVVSGVFTFGVRANAPPPTEAFGASGPTRSEDVVRWLYFLALALLVGGLGFRLLVLRDRLPARAEQRFYAVTGIGALVDAQRRNRSVHPPSRGRVTASVRPAALRRPLAHRAVEVRVGVHRDDTRLRARDRAPVPRVADGSRGAALACIPRRPGLCIGALAVGPLRRRRRLVVEVGARRLGASLGGLSLDRRASSSSWSSSGR